MPRSQVDICDEFDRWVDELGDSRDDGPSWVGDSEVALGSYVQDLVPHEVRRLRAAATPPPECETLVSVVGTTPQPILALIALVRPAMLILAHTDVTREVAQRIARLAAVPVALALDAAPATRLVLIDETDPTKIYRRLREALVLADVVAEGPPGSARPRRSTLFDVTGGKKTMVSAAFLLASELDIQAVYLDGDYVAAVHQPRPFTLRLRSLANPATALHLRDLRAVGRFFEEWRFGEAVTVLERVLAERGVGGASNAGPGSGAEGSPERDPEDDALRGTLAYARGCVAWEAARYGEAESLIAASGSDLPEPVKVLAADFGRGRSRAVRRLASKPEALLCFLVDGWRWVGRGNLEPRSATLRLYGLGELALSALVEWMLSNNALTLIGCPSPSRKVLKRAKDTLGSAKTASWLLLRGEAKEDDTFTPDAVANPFLPEEHREPQPDQGDSPPLRLDIPGATGASIPAFEPLEAAAWWLSMRWSRLRNDCAHRTDAVESTDVEALRGAARSLIGAVSTRMGFGDLVATWWTSPTFAPASYAEVYRTDRASTMHVGGTA